MTGHRRTNHTARRRAAAATSTVAAFLALGTSPLAAPPTAGADLDALFDPFFDAVADHTALADWLAPDSFGAADAASGAEPAAATDDAGDQLAASFDQLFYEPLHDLVDGWIHSDIGEAVDDVINTPFVEVLGRELIGDGEDAFTGTNDSLLGGSGLFGDLGDGGLLFGDGGAGADANDLDGNDGAAGGDTGLFGNGGDGGDGTADGAGGDGGAGGLLLGNGGDGGDGGDDDGVGGLGGDGAWLLGLDGARGEGDYPDHVTVDMDLRLGTEPVTELSVNGGPETDVLVDTGSRGLVMPIWDLGLDDLSWPTGFGAGAYSGGMNYVYAQFPAEIDFGGGAETTEPTVVDAVLFTYPTSLQDLFSGDYAATINEALAGSADGILGIGPNATGPEDASPTDALPGHLGDGVLLDQGAGELTFGPYEPTVDDITLDGAPITDLQVSIDGGPAQTVTANIDSGGVFGTLPSSLVGDAGSVDHIAVSTPDGELLYSYDVGATNAPTLVAPNELMNTGNAPFADGPIYIDSAGDGATTFIGAR